MVNNYTDLTLIKYIYQDTDICESLETEYLLEKNASARSRFDAFKYLSSLLSGLEYTPNSLNIQKLKLYSQLDEVQAN